MDELYTGLLEALSAGKTQQVVEALKEDDVCKVRRGRGLRGKRRCFGWFRVALSEDRLPS